MCCELVGAVCPCVFFLTRGGTLTLPNCKAILERFRNVPTFHIRSCGHPVLRVLVELKKLPFIDT